MVPSAEINRASRALGEAALDAARRGELHAARRLLLESTSLSDLDPRYLKALGYSALALGDISGAYQAWKKAEALLGGPGIIPWVRSLEHGILRVTVERFNNALMLVREGRYQDAVTMLARVHDEIPDFVPAGKLKGLALLAIGDRIGAHAAWTAQQELCRDDPELQRLITSIGFREGVVADPDRTPVFMIARFFEKTRVGAAGAALGIIALIMLWPRGRGESAPPASSTSLPVAAAASAATTPTERPSVAPSASTPATRPSRTPPSSPRASFSARYKQGAAAAQRGEWTRTIAYLGPVGELGGDETYHPHVLALLAQAYLTTNRTADARRVASRLIQRYPQSRYITPELRTVAGKRQSK